MGLEQRSDVWFGASLVAPNVQYVDHRHPPEEVYVVMSEGEWYREGRGWHTPGVGGVVYNPPNVVHSMRAGSSGAARALAALGRLIAPSTTRFGVCAKWTTRMAMRVGAGR